MPGLAPLLRPIKGGLRPDELAALPVRCERCGRGRLYDAGEGDLCCWQCGAVLYEKHGYQLPAVATGIVRRPEVPSGRRSKLKG